MFEIEYKGGNSIVIATKKSTLVSDPNLKVVGLKGTSVKDVVEVATEARLALNSSDARLLIEGPGEYEMGDFSIRGTGATRHIDTTADELLSTIYRIEVGDVRIALLGNISGKLNEEQLEVLGVIDIAIIPVGGNGYTLDSTSATSIVRQIEPKVVIPVHYADDGLKYEVPQDELSAFVKELGSPVETVTKYKVKSVTALPPVLTVVEVTRS
jgi:L-ascorbate metabolism protein UlaG (beta-lactamase superfamily)